MERPSFPRRRARQFTLLGLTLAAPLVIASIFELWVIDDAYISFRYAAQLATGNGLVFNSGERVEGITNLLWTLGLSLAKLGGLPLPETAVAAGIALGVCALWDAYWTARELGVSRLPAGLAIAAMALHPGYWLALSLGLETGLVSALLMRAVRLALSGRSPVGVGVLGALLFATRPDTGLLLPVFLAYEVFKTAWPASPETLPVRSALDGNSGRLAIDWRPALILGGSWLAGVAVITIWRLGYYGAPLPNTLAAKWIGDAPRQQLFENLRAGARYVRDFALTAAPLGVGASLSLRLLGRRPSVALAWALLACPVPAVLLNGGDWMSYFRLLEPYTPLLAVLTAVGLAAALPTNAWTSRRGLTATTIAAALVLGALSYVGEQYPWRAARPAIVAGEPCWEQLTQALEPALKPTDRIAPEALGLFGYVFLDNPLHDMLGLTDRTIATQGSGYEATYGKTLPAYTLDVVRPDLFLLHSGTGFLEPMVAVSAGRYAQRYATFSLHFGCDDRAFVASVRRDLLPRFEAALSRLNARPLELSPAP